MLTSELIDHLNVQSLNTGRVEMKPNLKKFFVYTEAFFIWKHSIVQHTDDVTDIIFLNTQILSLNTLKFFMIGNYFHRNLFKSDGMAFTTYGLIWIKNIPIQLECSSRKDVTMCKINS